MVTFISPAGAALSATTQPVVKPSFKAQMLVAREDAIVEAVNSLLAEKGFDLMTVDEVAAKVGIAKASLYKHFPSKEYLAAAAMVKLMQRAQDYLRELPVQNAMAQLRAVARWTPQQGERWGRELNPEPAKFQGEEARLLAGESNTDGRPVERVSWLEAIEFCSRLSQRTGRNYTLPSEAQWEFACRAGTSTAYYFGANIYSDLANFRGTDASRFSSPTPDPHPLFREQTTPVRMFPANAWGLHDMHGNVLEWCLDSVRSSYEGGPYDGSAWNDPQAPKEQQRITRGGSWSMPPRFCRSAFRSPFRSPSKADVTDGPFDDAGFRVACLPPGLSTAAAERPAAKD
jgi:formylglycine-generating enzyme required for sulfatase activity